MFSNDFGYRVEHQRRLDEIAQAEAIRQARQAALARQAAHPPTPRTSVWMVQLGALLVVWGTRLQDRGEFSQPAWVDPSPCP